MLLRLSFIFLRKLQATIFKNLLYGRRPVDSLVVDLDVDTGVDERRHVRAVERVKTSCIDLYSSVASH